ncbi:MAG: CRISPR-associated helicase Cas3' [Oscillospiraceae bacterium]|nr:CRISPR-associated helicase Cas3' [Oscillospiraceae bacterium]
MHSAGKSEPLEEHLKKTAILAEYFASAFGEGNAGKLMGWLHDMGKASELFQNVLKHHEHNVNHAAAGAWIANHFNKQAARAIYGHHDGLVWHIGSDIDRSLNKKGSQDSQKGKRFSISGKEQYTELFDYYKALNSIPKTRPELNKDADSFYTNLPQMLHTRMLLSCLCDSDYSATASHEDESIFEQALCENKIDADYFLQILTQFRNKIKAESNSDSELNLIRDEVYECCVNAASMEPGMFTLTAPTGTGKTLALLAFALNHAKQFKKSRIIIVLPFLSVISQNVKIYREICGDVLESHSMAKCAENDISHFICERWDSPVIVTTSVRFFEMLFKSKQTDLRSLHSIANSVIVFDEAQSIPCELTGTTIESMRSLCETFSCSVLFSTATQPAFDKRKDILFNAREIMTNPSDIYNRTRRVNVNWKTDKRIPLSEIAEELSKKKSVCCVLNRKDHTQKLFSELMNICSADEIFHISTDMCKSHRDNVLKEINDRLDNNHPCRLVSTSCIEAGVDLDFSNMYRAMAPLEAIVQCAGRCNRNGRVNGDMTVFIPDEEKLYPSKSYENAANKVLILLSKHEIDICNPVHICEYYTELFTASGYDHDKPALTEAITAHDFEKTEKEYRIIPHSGANVLVPYSNEIDLFDELVLQAHTGGISPKWMKQAAPITVSCYREDKLRDIAEQCVMFYKGKKYDVPGWYILHDEKFYDEKTGLHFTDDSSLDYLI